MGLSARLGFGGKLKNWTPWVIKRLPDDYRVGKSQSTKAAKFNFVGNFFICRLRSLY
ncbi:hypothetical protein RchiOBHm_Chr2g0091761 [Rosa chinensis]|uniref:Uncharacterized protein n=1 Tax=Rosa chinensis TaxID=74649 RepID=A0A2P6RJU6_ROSCH|nr:hypothetical protein RchiOBHm_Chr2g0091761 [Rosa chinensis]